MTHEIKNHTHFAPLFELWQHYLEDHQEMSGFKSFETFFLWSIECGYEPGKILFRKDTLRPFSPQNCQWRWKEPINRSYSKELTTSIINFDKAVAKIRKAYGLPPLPGSLATATKKK